MENQKVMRMTPPMGLSADEKEFQGYAIVFYDGSAETEYRLDDKLTERISRSAADKVIQQRQDVIISFNHQIDTILGRTGNDTAELSIDSKGLKYRCAFDSKDSDHVRIARKIERGLVSGSSFMGFFTKMRHTKEADRYYRNIDEVSLIECGPVVCPAYTGTEAGFRFTDDNNLILAHKELDLYLTELDLMEIETI